MAAAQGPTPGTVLLQQAVGIRPDRHNLLYVIVLLLIKKKRPAQSIDRRQAAAPRGIIGDQATPVMHDEVPQVPDGLEKKKERKNN